MNGSFAINRGLKIARKLLLDITEMGLPAAGEFLGMSSVPFKAVLAD
jgi:3-deoxy-7-phosphoheptulonate synthase